MKKLTWQANDLEKEERSRRVTSHKSKKLPLPNTEKALKEYDRTEYVRDMLCDKATTDPEILEWQLACNTAVAEVQEAFFQDTKDRNSRDHCKHASISWIRSLLQ